MYIFAMVLLYAIMLVLIVYIYRGCECTYTCILSIVTTHGPFNCGLYREVVSLYSVTLSI